MICNRLTDYSVTGLVVIWFNWINYLHLIHLSASPVYSHVVSLCPFPLAERVWERESRRERERKQNVRRETRREQMLPSSPSRVPWSPRSRMKPAWIQKWSPTGPQNTKKRPREVPTTPKTWPQALSKPPKHQKHHQPTYSINKFGVFFFEFVSWFGRSGSIPIGFASKFYTFCRYKCLRSSHGCPV